MASLPALPYDNVGHYRLRRLVGRGGFATVYVAVDDRLEAEVAVKLLADNHATDPDIRSRFIAEARTLRRIDHPNLLRVYDVGETERGQPYLILEFADRGDLASRVTSLWATGWRSNTADIEPVAVAVLGALTALHEQRLVHRDIKPDNLLLRTTTRRATDLGAIVAHDERLIVSDFGFAKDLAVNSGLSVGGGTAGFSAPEQLAGRPITTAADVFAAARVLQWILAGPSPAVPASTKLTEVLTAAVDEDPDRRPNAQQLLADIQDAVGPMVAPPPVHQFSDWQPGGSGQIRDRSERSKLVMMIAAVCLIATAALWMTFGRGSTLESSGGRVVDQIGNDEIVVVGPTVVNVGSEAFITAIGPDGVQFRWVFPDGSQVEDTNMIAVAPTSVGMAVVEVNASLPSGDMTTAKFVFEAE